MRRRAAKEYTFFIECVLEFLLGVSLAKIVGKAELQLGCKVKTGVSGSALPAILFVTTVLRVRVQATGSSAYSATGGQLQTKLRSP